jgi:mannose-6-phosphate isomerase-like protein (cupin superfamily)
MGVRRVVTGHDGNGKAVFASDEMVEEVPTAWFHRIWAADEVPTYPNSGAVPAAPPDYFPAVGGFRFLILSIPPDSAPPAAMPEVLEGFGGVERYLEDEPGMHTTDTIDFEVVLSGEVTLELDDGVEKVMRPGDTIVQNGTRHRWHNRGTEPAVFAAIVIGAHRES